MVGAIFLSLLSHLSFTVNNLAGAVGSRKLSAVRMTLYAWLCGCVIMALAAPFWFRGEVTLKPFLVNAAIAVGYAIAYPLFLIALEKGNATINGVIATTSPIWTVILSLLFFGESLTVAQTLCIIVIFAGVILSALHLTRRTKLNNLFNRYSLLALLVSLIWGACFAFIRYPVEQYGAFETNAITQVIATVLSVVFLVPILRKSKPRKFKMKDLKWPALNALTGFTGGLAYNTALTIGSSSVVAPIANSYPGLYAVASYFIFKEKLTKLQIVGICLTISGVLALSLVSL